MTLKQILIPIGVFSLILLANPASAAKAQIYEFQPDETEDLWHVGKAIRACTIDPIVEPPTVTYPDGYQEVIINDAEDCISFTLNQTGMYQITTIIDLPAPLGTVLTQVRFTTNGPYGSFEDLTIFFYMLLWFIVIGLMLLISQNVRWSLAGGSLIAVLTLFAIFIGFIAFSDIPQLFVGALAVELIFLAYALVLAWEREKTNRNQKRI